MNERFSSENVSTTFQQVAELARRAPNMVLTTLAHHIDIEVLEEAYRRTRKDGAPGVDGQTAEEYFENLDANLGNLLNRFKAGTYKAPPVRRTYIPKGDGTNRQRALGIPTFEDKVLQRAVTMVLEAVYEQEFYDFSYAYRPGRTQHQALQSLWQTLMTMNGGWLLEVDIQDCFGSLDHQHMRGCLDKRVRDGVIRKAIDKWLSAGVMEKGKIEYPEDGCPQGGVVTLVTMLQTLAPNRGQFKRECTNPERHVHSFLIDFDAFDERSDNLPFGFPIKFVDFAFQFSCEFV